MARDFTEQATALFTRFAHKHGLIYVAAVGAPIEVLWEFPIQHKLRRSIVLGLQNGDELNFGVGDFWAYFFPFDTRRVEFERVIDMWVEGDARIISKTGFLLRGLQLQTFENGVWSTAYKASSLSWHKRPPVILTNTPDR